MDVDGDEMDDASDVERDERSGQADRAREGDTLGEGEEERLYGGALSSIIARAVGMLNEVSWLGVSCRGSCSKAQLVHVEVGLDAA